MAIVVKFLWPEHQINFWIAVMFGCSLTNLSIFGWFMVVQSQMGLTSPWLFPYMVAAAGLSLMCVLAMIALRWQGKMIPDILRLASFILFVLWLAGLIGTSIQLFGTEANVNNNCQNYVINMEFKGPTINTLAWLTQKAICDCWKAAFALQLTGVVFYVWLFLLANRVKMERRNVEI